MGNGRESFDKVKRTIFLSFPSYFLFAVPRVQNIELEKIINQYGIYSRERITNMRKSPENHSIINC